MFFAGQIEKPLQKHGGRLEHNETYCGSCFGAEAVFLDHLLSFVSFCQFEVILCTDLISIMEPIGGPSFFFFFFITIIKDVLFILLYRTSYWYEAIL